MENKRRYDLAFSFRDKERLVESEQNCCDIACGLFPVPPPGELSECTDRHGGDCEPMKLAVALRRDDGKFIWTQTDAGTHMYLCEMMFDAPRGVWHYFKINKTTETRAIG